MGATAAVELSCDTGGNGLLAATLDCASVDVVLDTCLEPDDLRPLVPAISIPVISEI